MRRKSLLLFLCCIFCAPVIFSQKIRGTVTNTERSPLAGVYIQVMNTLQYVVSDSNGKFSLEMSRGKFVLRSSLAGYNPRTDTITVNDTARDVSIVLQFSIYEVEEVFVTANKQEETYIQAPLAVTSLSSAKINDTRTWEIGDLAGLVPNFQYGSLGVSYQQQVAIRGISVFSETPATATYIDGVNALDIAANGLQLIDIERIEILRGPQGTLYGRNAMGGVIHIFTKQPTNKTTAFCEASAGNQGLRRYGLGIKTPLVKDRLFLGISGQYQQQHGFYINDLSDKTGFLHEPLAGTPEDGLRMGDEESWYGNFFLKYIPSDKFHITINSKFQYDRSIGASAYYQAAENNIVAIEDPYKFAVNRVGSNSRLVINNSLAITYDHHKFRFFSISAYQYILQAYHGIDQDLYPYDLATGSSFRKKLGDAYPQGVFSQEFRFSSPAQHSKFRWTAGSYFFYQDYNKQYAAVYEDLALFFGMKPGTEVFKTHQYNTGVAIYGNLDYTLKSKWVFTVGLRLDYENRKTEVARYYLNDDGAKDYSVHDTMLNSHFSALSPKVSILYIISENHRVYISYSRGFRAGGNNMFSGSKYTGYQPEYSNNWEAGHKFQTRNKKFRVSTCLFLLDWENMQLDMQPEPGVWIIDNIGRALSYGAEIEVNAKPMKGMDADLAVGLNNSLYGNFMFLGENIKGNRTIMAPVYTLMAGLQQTVPVSKRLMWMIRGEYRSIGHQYFDLVNTIEQPAYHLFHARTGIITRHISFFIWIHNITNTTYITYAMPGYFKNSLVNRPRSFGATINFKI